MFMFSCHGSSSHHYFRYFFEELNCSKCSERNLIYPLHCPPPSICLSLPVHSLPSPKLVCASIFCIRIILYSHYSHYVFTVLLQLLYWHGVISIFSYKSEKESESIYFQKIQYFIFYITFSQWWRERSGPFKEQYHTIKVLDANFLLNRNMEVSSAN